jgi:hypothetical protein
MDTRLWLEAQAWEQIRPIQAVHRAAMLVAAHGSPHAETQGMMLLGT